MANIDCTKYIPKSGKKTCLYYLENGGCARKDELMCTEWVKRNPELAAARINDVGQTSEKPNDAPQPTPTAPAADPAPVRRGGLFGAKDPVTSPATPESGSQFVVEPTPLKNRLQSSKLDVGRLQELVNSGIEAKLEVPGMGTVWLVPAYTEQKRQELTFGDASLILAVKEVFPRAELTEITKPNEVKRDNG